MEEACYEEEGGIKNADSDINDSDYDFSEGDDKSGADEDDRDYQKNVDDDLDDGQLGKKQVEQVWPDDGAFEEEYLQPLCSENDLLSSFKPRIFTVGTVEMETTQGEIAQSTSKM
jgi:hypothetical protein